MYAKGHRLEKQREAQRKYRERNAEELKIEVDRIRESGVKREYWREKTQRNRVADRAAQRALDAKYYRNAKEAAFKVLGNKCAKCDYSNSQVLQVDHIIAIGDAERRKQNQRGRKLYVAVLKAPEKFQLLCPTHNWEKRVEMKEHKQVNRSDTRNISSALA